MNNENKLFEILFLDVQYFKGMSVALQFLLLTT